MLAEIGYTAIVRAETVEEALRKLQVIRPVLVVLDASLRGVAAYQVAAQLNDERIPFVVSTGYDIDKLPVSFHYGVPLKKPYDRRALVAALEAALALRKDH
jgi:DNA-binding response OmpR family regulator